MKRKKLGLHLLLLVISIFCSTILHAQSINIISPNGGETWPALTTQTITWVSSGTSGDVKIDYSGDYGINWNVVAASTTDDGSYTWLVPDIQSIYCMLRIRDIDGDPTKYSDAFFTISNSPGFISDSLALVALYNSTNGSGWNNKTNWLSSPVNNWYGITLYNGRVSKIILGNNKLTGTLPPEIGDMSNLKNLYLYNNQLTGSIPSEIGHLTNLTDLSISSNQLTGSIPSEIGNLSNLKTIHLSENQLNGSIPAEIGSFSNLIYLQLSNNQLSGSIPHEIGNLTNLLYLYLHDNQLTGNIPAEIGNLSNIRTLSLKANQLMGSVPLEIGNLSNLTVLHLYNNQLTGDIPNAITNLVNLQQLVINNNELVNLPEISALASLENLSIHYNKFTFEDIEPNVGVSSSVFMYSPQDSVGNRQNISLMEGDVYVLSVSVDGEHNIYQWYKNDVIISGANGSQYYIVEADLNDQGIYECHITNSVANLLTLYTRPINITVIPAPIRIISPNGGENWTTLTMHDITWSSSGTSGYIRIEYSTNNGNDWNEITESTIDDGLFTWQIPNEISTNCIVRLSDTDGESTDVSDAVFSITEIPGIIIDSLALVAIYDNTDGSNWSNHNNWKTSMLSSWFGITVENGRVTQVNLFNNRLKGKIPPEIGDLSNLQIIDLSFNYLTGSIPSEIKNLSNLQELILEMNQLTGNMPAEIENLSNLRVLNLNTNQLTGNIISEIGNLTNLQVLELENNQLIGNIPSVIWNMTNLQTLSLGVNQLTGTILSEIGNLSNLQNLSLRMNQLTGNIPAEIGNLTNLQVLKLDDNQLTGNIPSVIWNLSDLTTLDLSLNQLTGNIPPEVENLSSLYSLLLGFNQLSGNIPDEIGNLSDLFYLHLGNNQLTGDIPVEIWNLYELQFLWLDSNQLTGQIPAEIGNLSHLRFLFLDDNKLTGNLPDELANLTELQMIYLGYNSFESLPVLSELVYPVVLSVEENKLTFEDIEPNIGLSLVFNYVPQDSVGLKQSFSIPEGNELSVSVAVGGTSNQYQWYKNGVMIPGGNSTVNEISNAKTSDAGIYECHINNTVATELTLYSRPITVTVIPNTQPVVTDIPDQTVDEGSTFASINLDDYVSDVETVDADVIWSHSGNTELVVTIIDRVASITTPDVNWNGSKTITFTATDDNAVNPLSGSNAATFNVTAVNDAPVVTGQNPLASDEDKSLTISISDFSVSDVDNPAGPFTLSVNSGSNYTLSGTTITPATNYNGILTIPVKVSDGIAASNPFDALVTITPVNDQPVVTDIPNQSIGEGGSFGSISLDQYVSDIETPDADISWSCSGNSELMVSIINRIAAISVPSSHWNGSETLIFKATDNDLVNPLSDSNDVTFTVTNMNSSPVVSNLPDQTIQEGTSFETVNLDDFVTDTETPDEDIHWTYTGDSELMITISNRIVTISVPDKDWFGSEVITFTATDDDAEIPLSGSDVCTFTVINVNDPPVLGDIPDQFIDINASFVSVNLDDFVEDLETGDFDISWICSGYKELIVTITDRIATITKPDAGWIGSDTLTFIATDNDPVNPLSGSDMTIFTVVYKNEAPVLGEIPDQTIDEGASFEAISLDNFVEDDVTADENISWTFSGSVDLAITISNRVATVTLPDENWNGSERIIFTATDDDPVNPLSGDTGTLFTVIAVNDVPVVSDIPDQTIHKGEVFSQIDMDDFVEDIETKDENIKWSYAGNDHVQIDIIDCIAYFTLVDSTWYGSDTITFTAIDDDFLNPLSASKTIIFTVEAISGSAEISVIDDMSPYPNPTDRYVIIPWNHHEKVKLTIEISNMNGEILSVQNDVIWEKQVEIDMHDFYPGVYYIRMITTDNARIFKVIKR